MTSIQPGQCEDEREQCWYNSQPCAWPMVDAQKKGATLIPDMGGLVGYDYGHYSRDGGLVLGEIMDWE